MEKSGVKSDGIFFDFYPTLKQSAYGYYGVRFYSLDKDELDWIRKLISERKTCKGEICGWSTIFNCYVFQQYVFAMLQTHFANNNKTLTKVDSTKYI